MAELVDALASGASVFTDVLVQIQSRVPRIFCAFFIALLSLMLRKLFLYCL